METADFLPHNVAVTSAGEESGVEAAVKPADELDSPFGSPSIAPYDPTAPRPAFVPATPMTRREKIGGAFACAAALAVIATVVVASVKNAPSKVADDERPRQDYGSLSYVQPR